MKKYYDTKAQVNQAARRKAKIERVTLSTMQKIFEEPNNKTLRNKLRELFKMNK